LLLQQRKQQHIAKWIIKSPENRRGAWEAALRKHLKAKDHWNVQVMGANYKIKQIKIS